MTYMCGLPFPGNVRELENMLERALALCDGKTITVQDLYAGELPETALGIETLSAEPSAALNLTDYLEDIEKKAILQALQKTNNNKTAAAKLLGVTFRTLRYRLAKLGLSKDTDLETEDNRAD